MTNFKYSMNWHTLDDENKLTYKWASLKIQWRSCEAFYKNGNLHIDVKHFIRDSHEIWIATVVIV